MAWGLTIIYIAVLVIIHIRTINVPVPIDLFETTMPAITGLIAHGHIPYTAAYEPIYMDPYPPLYNIVMVPFVLAFGNSLFIHRLVAGIFIGLCCWICFYAARKKGIPALYTTIIAALVYAALLYYSTPVASTNALGTFLFLASIIIPWARNFTWPSLFVSLATGILAFYAKQYFVFAPVYVALYLFLFRSKLRAIQYGVLFGSVLLLSLVLVNHICPFFLGDTIFAQRNRVALFGSLKFAYQQMIFFVKIYAGIFILVLICGARWLIRWRRRERPVPDDKQSIQLNITTPNAALFDRTFEYFTFCFIVSTLLIGLFLGKNPGNFMTYLFQMMTPFMLLSVFGMFRQRTGKTVGKAAILSLPLLLWCMYNSYSIISKDFDVDPGPWQHVDQLIKENNRILTSSILVMSMIDNNKYLYNAGKAGMFPASGKRPSIFGGKASEKQVDEIWSEYKRKLQGMYEHKEFDLLLIFGYGSHPEEFNRYYTHTETIPLSLTKRRGGGTWGIQVWLPKP